MSGMGNWNKSCEECIVFWELMSLVEYEETQKMSEDGS